MRTAPFAMTPKIRNIGTEIMSMIDSARMPSRVNSVNAMPTTIATRAVFRPKAEFTPAPTRPVCTANQPSTSVDSRAEHTV
ncbi:MAG: hypothetical protein ABS81_22680 [Pseudonocardia sp. SCN 72-86]|nr:MAG: hypothetical protein ABS81_22680 [Pseudonocardia sp. SCN 72-86]